MGHFAQLNDDDAELLSGGKTNSSGACGGSNYGQYLKSGCRDFPNHGGHFAQKKCR